MLLYSLYSLLYLKFLIHASVYYIIFFNLKIILFQMASFLLSGRDKESIHFCIHDCNNNQRTVCSAFQYLLNLFITSNGRLDFLSLKMTCVSKLRWYSEYQKTCPEKPTVAGLYCSKSRADVYLIPVTLFLELLDHDPQ